MYGEEKTINRKSNEKTYDQHTGLFRYPGAEDGNLNKRVFISNDTPTVNDNTNEGFDNDELWFNGTDRVDAVGVVV